jgi:hypothetical protein
MWNSRKARIESRSITLPGVSVFGEKGEKGASQQIWGN